MQEIERVDVVWFPCPFCGKNIPCDEFLAERHFNHIVIPNGDGRTVKLLCPEHEMFTNGL